MKNPLNLLALSLVSSLLFLSGPATAQPTTLKFSVSLPADDIGGLGLQRFADLVNERSKGDLEIRPFFNNQLGGEVEVAQGIQLGSVEGGLMVMAVFSRWVPEGDVFELPFIYNDRDHWLRVLKSDEIMDFASRYENHGFKILAYTTYGSRNLISTFPITTPDDIKGKKMRIMQNPMHASTWQALGANPTPIPAPEIYNALQTKLVDFFDNSTIAWRSAKFYEVGPHLIRTAHMYQPIGYVVSKAVFDRLSPEQQEVLVAAARDAADYGIELSARMEADAAREVAQDGLGTVHDLQDRAAWAAGTQSVRDEWAQSIPGGEALVETVLTIQ